MFKTIKLIQLEILSPVNKEVNVTALNFLINSKNRATNQKSRKDESNIN